ncbi:MAG: GNAT family N-acetyltransferase [Planctomycetota bacterium]
MADLPHQLDLAAWTASELSQLRMELSISDAKSPPPLPARCELRGYELRDREDYLRLLRCGEFGEWDLPRLDDMLAGGYAPLPREAIFFATFYGVPIAAACGFVRNEFGGETPEIQLGWVVVEPKHRGQGLGKIVTHAVIDFAKRRGIKRVWLGTEDPRLAAIKTYLDLGFTPRLVDDSQSSRWATLCKLLT